MNRQQRRAKKALGRNQPVKAPGHSLPILRTLAVHEAGHCVARVLTAQSLGWDAGEVIECIDVGSAPIAAGMDQDRKHGLRSQVVSYGRFLSRPMQEFVAARRLMALPRAPDPALGNDAELVLLFAEMRTSGIDVDGWFQAKSIVAVFGPMAEAKLVERPFNEVWNNNPSKDDQRGLIRAGTLCGMTREQIATAAGQNVTIAEQHMSRSEVWDAIITLADNLKLGRMSGREAAALITRALAANEVTHA
jgi:hypothetical protein